MAKAKRMVMNTPLLLRLLAARGIPESYAAPRLHPIGTHLVCGTPFEPDSLEIAAMTPDSAILLHVMCRRADDAPDPDLIELPVTWAEYLTIPIIECSDPADPAMDVRPVASILERTRQAIRDN